VIRRLSGLALLLAAVASLPGARAAAPAPQAAPLVLRSALVSVSATAAPGGFELRITRTADHSPISARGAVSAKLDGHNAAVTAQPGGSYLLSTRGVGGGSHSLDVVVSHDGIREQLTGTLTVPRTRGARGVLGALEGHGMFAWWVLNFAVVLIAVLAISRRKT
jgi:hypothetical protein